MKTFLLLTTAATIVLGPVSSGYSASVKLEAESGTRGADYAIGTNGATQYIYPTSSSTATNPGTAARVVTYTVTFPEAGTYDLYARVQVGSGGANNDSFFYGNGFGSKSPTNNADWILCNNLSTVGFTNATDTVTGGGTAGNQVWKWINLSEFNGGAAPITFTVTAGNLTQTFQIGAREAGLYLDAFVFGTATYTFTVAELDAGADGNPPPLPQSGQCTVDWNAVYQRIDGFGASSAWRTSLTTAQADQLFSTNTGIGLSLLRTRIAPDGTTIENSIMLQAKARGAKVWSAPWSPPAAFKDSGAVDGGSYLGSGANATNLAYARQLANYVVNMSNTYGISLCAISVQNEPDVNHPDPGGYETCLWTSQQIHDFTTNLYNALVASNVASTLILLPESAHWDDPHGLGTATTNDPVVLADVGILAYHNYVTNNAVGDTNMPVVVNSYGKALWETEVSLLSGSDSSISNGLYYGQRIHLFMTVAQANAWHYWWLISGNGVGNQGLMDNNAATTKRLFAVGQYSRFVRPGYYRIDATNTATALISAYKDPVAGNFAIVAINSGSNTINQTFTLTNVTAATSVTPWITSASLNLASQTAVAVTNSTFTYTLPAQSIVTFVGQAATNFVTNVASFTASPTNGVAPLTVTFTDTSTGSITNRFWDFGDGNTTNFTASTNPTHTYAAGMYNVTLMVSGSGYSNTNTKPNYITAVSCTPPTASVSGGQTICQGGSATIQAALTGTGPWNVTWLDGTSGTNYMQNGVAASPATRTVSPSSTTTYSVTAVSDASGCSGGTSSGSAVVTVNPIPSAPTAGNNGPVCVGSTLSLTASTVSGATYSWTGPNGFTSSTQNPTVSTSAATAMAGTYSVTATVNGCTSAAGQTMVTVSARPTSVASGSATVCSGSSTTIQAALTGTGPWNVTWSDAVVQNGVASSPATRSVSPSSTTTYTVTALTDASCMAQAGDRTGSAVVTVNSIPATPSPGNNGPICSGQALNLFANTTADSYSWTGPNSFSSTNQDPSIANATTAASGTYSLTVTVNGCTSAAGSTAATVNAIPAMPTAGNNGPILAGNTLNLIASTLSGGTCNWTGPNGFASTNQNPSISNATSAASGIYGVTVTDSNGCTSAAGSTTALVTALQITSIRTQGSDILITWATTGGTTNAVQATPGTPGYNTNFVDISVPPLLILGSGDTSTNYADSGAATNSPVKFYRVRLVP
jgi:O-glycosyl hydrolase